jgi:hypothetical protein
MKAKYLSNKAEEMRLKSVYRKYAMREGVPHSSESLRTLIGPDGAYHLYRNFKGDPLECLDTSITGMNIL